jgi:hypothetical protein
MPGNHADRRRYAYEPPWPMRGLTELHLEFGPTG